MIETIYMAGGCLWGVQHFCKRLPGVISTEAGRANGSTNSLDTAYDGYAECVKVQFDNEVTSVPALISHLFEIIDPYSIDRQGADCARSPTANQLCGECRGTSGSSGTLSGRLPLLSYSA